MSSEMREPTFLVLASLADGPRHGYALIAEAEAISEGRVRLRPGTLYATLDRLREDGLVAVHSEEVVDGRLRRYHALTQAGVDGLVEQVARLRRNADQASRRLRAAAAVTA